MSDNPRFEAVYTEYYGLVFYFLLAKTRNREAAEDLAAQTFINVVKNWDQLKDPAKIKAWIFSIAHNEFCMFKRSPLVREWEALDDPDQSWHERLQEPRDFTAELEKRDTWRRVRAAIQAMNAAERNALDRFVSGKPCQGTWGSRLFRAKRLLISRLDRQDRLSMMEAL